MKLHLFLAAAVLGAGLAVGCGPEELTSASLDRKITVDGDAGDWKGILQFLEDGNISCGLTNDAHSLYIVLVVGDRQVRRQVIVSGLYLWFDPKGEKDKRFGIRFPIGLQESAADVTPMMREQDPNQMRALFDENIEELMVIGPHDESWRRAAVGTIGGIETAAKADPNMLVIECKVPVANDGQYGYGVGALPGGVIGLGLETPKLDMEDLRERMGVVGDHGGGMGGDLGPGEGIGGGGRGGPPTGGQRPRVPEPIKVWTRVHLATGAANS